MSLSKKALRGIRAFNHLKYNTKKVVYNVKRVVNTLDSYVQAFKEIQNDTTISETGTMVGKKVSGETGSL